MVAPTCELPNRVRPDLPGRIDLTTVPPATDLKSALAAINALRGAMMQMSSQLPQQERTTTPGSSGFSTKKTAKKTGWKELGRVKKLERVENPDDPGQFVMVEVIVQLTMGNAGTGEKWTWTR